MSIFVSSDYHYGHDKDFIWQARGFSSVDEMNQAILERHNSIVSPEDTVYTLGDLMVGGQDEIGIEFIKKMNGHFIVVAGNHDSPRRKQQYIELGFPVYDATTLDYKGYHFYLSHYPTITSNLDDKGLKHRLLCLYGHTHQQTNFYEDRFYLYHVGVDSHDCCPVNIDTIIEDIKNKVSNPGSL